MNDKYQVNEKMDGYNILNLYYEYEIPSEYESSNKYTSFLECNQYIKYLEELKRDPSYYISILGYYIADEDNEEYLQVIYKVKAIY